MSERKLSVMPMMKGYGKNSYVLLKLKEWITEQLASGHGVDVEVREYYWSDVQDKIHSLNPLNMDQAFTITKRELLEKLK